MQKSSVSLTKAQLEKGKAKKVENKVKSLSKFEQDIARNIKDFINDNDKSSQLKDFKIVSATEVNVKLSNNKTEKVGLIYLNYVSLNSLRKIAPELISYVEEKKKMKCLFTVKRNIESKFVKLNRKQKRPRSRTLTSVFDNILDDILLPGIITGKRIRFRGDGSHFYRIYVNKESEEELKHKQEVVSQIYKKLTGRTINIEFYSPQLYYDTKKITNKKN